MSRKNSLQFEVATAQSLAASFNSPPTNVKKLDNCAYQINITTSNSQGTFALQGSNDYQTDELGNITNSGTWASLSLGGGTPTVAAANDTIMIAMNQIPFLYIRLAYTSTVAGTGHCDIWIVAKMIGG